MRNACTILIFLGLALPLWANQGSDDPVEKPTQQTVKTTHRLLDVRIQNLDLKKASLFDTLRFLSSRAELQLAIHPDVQDRKITLQVKDLSLYQVLKLLLHSEGLDFKVHPAGSICIG